MVQTFAKICNLTYLELKFNRNKKPKRTKNPKKLNQKEIGSKLKKSLSFA